MGVDYALDPDRDRWLVTASPDMLLHMYDTRNMIVCFDMCGYMINSFLHPAGDHDKDRSMPQSVDHLQDLLCSSLRR